MVFAAGADEILKRFLAFKAKVVISAEGFLWPDKSLLVMTYINLKFYQCQFSDNYLFSVWSFPSL